MGSPTDELGRMPESYSKDEAQHQATIGRDYWMQATEVTQQQWKDVTFSAPPRSDASCADCPVDYVTWLDATRYCNLLSAREGLPSCYDATDGSVLGSDIVECGGYRLPTEAEWEYAARAGTTTATYAGDLTSAGTDDQTLLSIAWFGGNSGGESHPVGKLKANAWGLYDMLGNVAEWTTEVSPESAGARFRRGGGYSHPGAEVRAAHRSINTIGQKMVNVGFRVVRTVP